MINGYRKQLKTCVRINRAQEKNLVANHVLPGSKRYNLAKTFRKMAKDRTTAADGGLMKVSGYKPVLGNNKFGYPSGGVPVTSFRGGG